MSPHEKIIAKHHAIDDACIKPANSIFQAITVLFSSSKEIHFSKAAARVTLTLSAWL
jgi:hypothetical protein